MADLDYTSPQGRGKVDMAVAGRRCAGMIPADKIADYLDIAHIVAATVDTGLGKFDFAVVADSGNSIPGLAMSSDEDARRGDSRSCPVHHPVPGLFHAPCPDLADSLEIHLDFHFYSEAHLFWVVLTDGPLNHHMIQVFVQR